MAKRKRPTADLVLSNLGFQGHVFDHADILCLLRAAIEREGSQVAFAKRHNVDRAFVNMVLNGKRSVGDSLAAALGLRKVYIATSDK